jgi:hypothetical protein
MIGRQLVGGTGTGIPIALSFDGRPEWKPVGVTIDWTTVAAVSGSAVVTPEGFTVPVGQKWLRYGQPLVRITTAEAQTITVTGTPTGGSFTINVYNPATGASGIVTIPYNAAVATTQGLFDAFFGAGNTVVSGAGALPGNVQTVTFGGTLTGILVPVFALGANNLTGGTAPTAAFAISAGSATGKFGPYSDAATDGRQTVDATRRGEVFLLNESLVQAGLSGLGMSLTINTDQVGVVAGGRVWKARLLANASAGSLAAGPTYANLYAAMPRLIPVD